MILAPSVLDAAFAAIMIAIRRSPRVSKLPLALFRSLYHKVLIKVNLILQKAPAN